MAITLMTQYDVARIKNIESDISMYMYIFVCVYYIMYLSMYILCRYKNVYVYVIMYDMYSL